MADKQNKHQADLAASGYRLPDSFYVRAIPEQQSTEKQSGDGGKAATAKQVSEHGYQGDLQSLEDYQASAPAAQPTVDPETGLTNPEAHRAAAEAASPAAPSAPAKKRR